MSGDFKLTRMIVVALQDFVEAIKPENIPDPGDGFRGFYGLPLEYRRMLFVLDHYERYVRRKGTQDKTAPALGGHTSVTSRTPSADAKPVMPESPEGGVAGTRFIPPEFNEPPPAPKVPMTADTHAADDQKPADGLQPVAPAPVATAPQPGGVPPLPARSVVSENISVMPMDTVKKAVFLKNAKAGEPYEGVVEIDGLKSLRLEDAAGSGLVFDESTGLLKGTPIVSGDFQIRLRGVLHGKPADIAANLAVIPDPKSLWVSKDNDRNDPFWKPNEAFGKAEGELLCVAASKRGRSHAKDGTFRDDDFGLLVTGPGGWHIAVVADGAGSAKFSRRGSKVAVDSVLKELPKLLEDHVTPQLEKLVPAFRQGHPDAEAGIKSQLYQSLATAAFNAAKAIEDEAGVHGEKVSAFSTTLIVTIAKLLPEGWFLAGFSVGDGGAGVFDVTDGSFTTLTLPDSGEFAGQTRFLQRSEFSGGFEDVAKRIFFDVRKSFTALMLMTDGISDPKFPTETVFADPARWVEFWNGDLTRTVNLSRTNADLEKQFLDWLDFWSPGNHDDRTLAVLVP